MTLLYVTSESLASSGGTVTCHHCHGQFKATIKETDAGNTPIIDENAQASLILEALQPRQHSSRMRVGWFIVNLILVLILAGQYAYFKRNELATHVRFRPWLQSFCQVMNCKLELLRDTSQIRIISREVRSHPSIDKALQISLTIRNEAPFRQPWPTLQLAFSDINGRTIAQRSFPPADYLPDGSSLTEGMPSRQSIYTSLVLIDPGKNAVNFVFDFK